MGVYKVINHNKLGEIYCKTDEEEPICWAKKEKVNLFSNKEDEVEILLDLYKFNKEFQCRDKTEGTKNEEAIIKWYQTFLCDKKNIEQALWDYYRYDMEKEYDDYYSYDDAERPDLKSKEELYEHIEVQYVIIYTKGYVVVVSVSWGWMSLAINVDEEEDEEENEAYVTVAQELMPAELDYFY